jgi:flavodoxin
MKVIILVHSRTGNTFKVAKLLRDKLVLQNHYVVIEKLEVENDNEQDPNRIIIKNVPSIDEFDVVILGSPVRGFSLSPAMKYLLKNIDGLDKKVVLSYMTQFFPKASLGGNQAIKQLRIILQKNGVELKYSKAINWMFETKRNQLINTVIQDISNLL